MRVSVIGGSTIDEETASLAEALGRELAERGHTIVCGGLGGAMRAVCRGAVDAGGETIGILPVDDVEAANSYVTTPIATGLGHARNPLVVMNGEAVVAIDGAGGTLSEIGFASVYDRPIAGLRTHDLDVVEPFDTPGAVVTYLERAVADRDI